MNEATLEGQGRRSTRDEREALARFSEAYSTPGSAAAARVEQAAIGAVWGANGYTTVAQADELGRRLELSAGRRLLDVGTGRGWPGIYLAEQTGCSVVGADMPLDGLRAAIGRARSDGLADTAAVVAASAAALPFRPRSFDAVLSTDVLC